jgi:hypothetical protein
MVEPIRTNQSQTTPTLSSSSSHYAPLTNSERFKIFLLLNFFIFYFYSVNDMH